MILPVRPMSGDRHRGRTLLTAVAVAGVLAVSGCSAGAPPTTASEAPSAPASPTSATTPSASPTPSPAPSSAKPSSKPSAKPSRAPALKKVKAGTVTNTKSTSVSGSGPADLRFTTKGEFAVVVRVDCSRCRGDFSLTAPERMSPLGKNKAPLKASYLVSLFKDDSPKQSVQLTATGRWKVTFLSWNDLPESHGKQSGKGSTVLYLGDRASRLKVSYKPSGKGDSFDARVFNAIGQPLIFGETDPKPFTETEKVELPAVISITTNGSWTLTPR